MSKNNNIASVTQEYLFPAEILHTDSLYHEFLNNSSMRAGVYTLKAGEKDLQSPHKEDEMYYVLHGKSSMIVGEDHFEVNQGDCIFVPASVEHRFVNITEDLKLLVFFSKVEKIV